MYIFKQITKPILGTFRRDSFPFPLFFPILHIVWANSVELDLILKGIQNCVGATNYNKGDMWHLMHCVERERATPALIVSCVAFLSWQVLMHNPGNTPF